MCYGLSAIPEKIENSKYFEFIYTPSTDHIRSLIYITTCHTLKEMTPMVVAKVDEREGSDEEGIDNSTDGDENTAGLLLSDSS